MGPKNLRGQRQISTSRIFWLCIAGSSIFLIYYLAVIPFLEGQKKAAEEIILKKKILVQYNEILQNRPLMENSLEKAKKQYEEIQKRLISADTLQLAAANLQDMVKKIAEKNFVSLRSFRILEPKDVGPFRQVALQIDFLPLSNMLNLSNFIYELENQEKLIIIREMDLLILNPRMPNALQGNLVISAFIKGGKVKEKDKEK